MTDLPPGAVDGGRIPGIDAPRNYRGAPGPGTPRTRHDTRPQSDEQATDVRPDRPTSPEPLNRRTLNLAESHAHEADRLAESRAGLTHALLAHFWLNHARTEQA